MRCDRVGRALHVREVGLALRRERRRHRDHDRLGVCDDGEIGGRRDRPGLDERLQPLRGDVLDVALAAVDRVDDVLDDVDEHDALAGLCEGLGVGHADVARADHCDLGVHRCGSVLKACGDPFGGVPVAVELRPVVGHPRRADGLDEPVGVVVDENVRTDLDRVHPFRRRPCGHARHAVPVRLLLEPAGVGDDHACLRGERGEVEVAERRESGHCPGTVPGHVPSTARSRLSSAGVRGRRPARPGAQALRGAGPAAAAPRWPLGAMSQRGMSGGWPQSRPESTSAPARSARSGRSRPPSRRRRPRFSPRRAHPRGSRASARPGRRAAARAGRSRSDCAPPASTGRRSAGRPPRARAERPPPPQPARRRASSSCRRRRAPSRGAPRRSPRRARDEAPRASPRGRARRPRAGSAAARARARRRTPARARGRSAARCGGRPPRFRPRGAPPTPARI